MEEEKNEVVEYDSIEFPNEEIWEALKAEIATQHTPEDGEK